MWGPTEAQSNNNKNMLCVCSTNDIAIVWTNEHGFAWCGEAHFCLTLSRNLQGRTYTAEYNFIPFDFVYWFSYFYTILFVRRKKMPSNDEEHSEQKSLSEIYIQFRENPTTCTNFDGMKWIFDWGYQDARISIFSIYHSFSCVDDVVVVVVVDFRCHFHLIHTYIFVDAAECIHFSTWHQQYRNAEAEQYEWRSE